MRILDRSVIADNSGLNEASHRGEAVSGELRVVSYEW